MSSDGNKGMKRDSVRDRDQDEQTRPGIARPGEQPDQQQIPSAPPQPESRHQTSSSRWIPPTSGNPDLEPAGQHGSYFNPSGVGNPNVNPLTPQGMIYDPGQLLDLQRRGSRPDTSVPPGARFDPFGPPDASLVGPGRGPLPSSQFGVPDPDHFQPPGQPQQPPLGGGKSLKFPWPPGGRGSGSSGAFPPPGGAGGSPFL